MMMMQKEKEAPKLRSITKKVFHKGLICPRLGWEMYHNNAGNESSLTEQFKNEQKRSVKRLARKLFPPGKLVRESDPEAAAIQTQYLINDPNVYIIFDATFIIDGFYACIDIVVRERNGWHIKEVKADTVGKNKDAEALAYARLVVERAGISVDQCSLILISSHFRLGMPNEKLFTEKNLSKEVEHIMPIIEPMMDPLQETIRSTMRPLPDIRYECKNCSLFERCIGKGVKHHIFSLPSLTREQFHALRKHGTVDFLKIPKSIKLTRQQEIVQKSHITGKPYIGEQLPEELDAIILPAFYLHFAFVSSPLPFYYDSAPQELIPTAFSIHKCYEPGRIIKRHEYIADPRRDCRREMSKELVRDLEKEGSIVVFSSTGQSLINQLASVNPDLAPKLFELSKRFLSFEPLFRTHFYHPACNGSTSIEKILTALTGSNGYEHLSIVESAHARAAFAFMAMGIYENSKSRMIKRKLLEYCKQNTLALMHIHQKLLELVDASQNTTTIP